MKEIGSPLAPSTAAVFPPDFAATGSQIDHSAKFEGSCIFYSGDALLSLVNALPSTSVPVASATQPGPKGVVIQWNVVVVVDLDRSSAAASLAGWRRRVQAAVAGAESDVCDLARFADAVSAVSALPLGIEGVPSK